MLEQRVEKVEERLARIESILVRLELKIIETAIEIKQVPKFSDLARLQSEIGEMRGRLANVPSSWQTLTMIISTWVAGTVLVTGTVFDLLRYVKP